MPRRTVRDPAAQAGLDRALITASTIDEATTPPPPSVLRGLIDAALRDLGTRALISTSEVTDLLLDLRNES